jgi:probable rRNA maturation factor
MNELYVRNRQRGWGVEVALLRQIASELLAEIWPGDYQIGVLLVGQREMARLNQDYLSHEGSTDVITFSYEPAVRGTLHGEIVICLDVAAEQARQFGTSWQQELVRYLVHGVLHCLGYDDTAPAKRARMKKAEQSWLQRLQRQFPLERLARKPVRGLRDTEQTAR